MDPRKAPINATGRRAPIRTLRSLNKVTHNLAPVNVSLYTLKNVLSDRRGHRAPVTCLLGFFCCLLNSFLQSLFRDLLSGALALAKLSMVIKAIGALKGIAVAVAGLAVTLLIILSHLLESL